MGWGFRKSFRLGKGFRINLSRSGIGLSTGVKGFRIGVGPRGAYSSVSAGGFTYRAGLGGRSGRRAGGSGGRSGSPSTDSLNSALGCLTLVLFVAAFANPVLWVGVIALATWMAVRQSRANRVRKAYAAAVVAFQEDRRPEAVDALLALEREAPQEADPFLLRAALQFNAGQHEDALSALEQAAQRAKTIGRLSSGGPQVSVQFLDLPLRVDLWAPAGMEILVTFALLGSGRKEEALRRISAAVDALPDDGDLLIVKAHALAVAAQPGDAVRLLQAWPEDHEHYLLALALLSGTLVDMGQPDAAVEALRRGLRRRKDRDALKLLRYNLARIFDQQGRAREAAREYTKILAEDLEYRDVKERLAALNPPGGAPAAGDDAEHE